MLETGEAPKQKFSRVAGKRVYLKYHIYMHTPVLSVGYRPWTGPKNGSSAQAEMSTRETFWDVSAS